MIGVAQNNLRLDVVQVLRGHGFNRAVSANGHKHRRFHRAVVQFQGAAPCVSVCFV